VAVALVQANLTGQLEERIPLLAPTFFFIDIQPDQVALFDRSVESVPGVTVKRAPMVRGRITRLKDIPVDKVAVADDAAWILRGDRGLSTADRCPDDTAIVAGDWWPADYDGPPLVSLDAAIAKGFGLGVGDTITVTVLGRELTLRIANLRRIAWSSMAMNFTFILTPNALAGAPQSFIATVHAPPGRERAVEQAVSDSLPNVSAIRVQQALELLRRVITELGTVLRIAAAVSLVSGAMVLAATLAAGQRQRLRDAVLFKVLGARRRDLLHAALLEFTLLGAAAGLVAAVAGSGAAWAVLTQGLRGAEWHLLMAPVATVVAGSMVAVTLAGLAGTAQALAAKPAAYLREE
jgi:putative ABC transport system permease protein